MTFHSLKSWLDRAQRLAAKSPLLVRMAVKARNQADAIIGYSVAPTPDPTLNGEHAILKRMRGRICRFVDVGANVGDWTALVLHDIAPQANGLLFEPNPAAANALLRHFGNHKGIDVVAKALSDHTGKARFFAEPACGQTSSLVTGASATTAEPIEVEITTLDLALRAKGWESVDFLKIDAEGHDFHVLSGARNLLERKAVLVVQFEYNASWALNGRTLAGAVRLLEGFGYETRLLAAEGPRRFDYAVLGEFFRYANFAAATPEQWRTVDRGGGATL